MRKYKVNIDRKIISTEEVGKKIDFNSFIKEYHLKINHENSIGTDIKDPTIIKKGFVVTKGWFISTIVATALTCSVVTYFYTLEKNKQKEDKKEITILTERNLNENLKNKSSISSTFSNAKKEHIKANISTGNKGKHEVNKYLSGQDNPKNVDLLKKKVSAILKNKKIDLISASTDFEINSISPIQQLEEPQDKENPSIEEKSVQQPSNNSTINNRPLNINNLTDKLSAEMKLNSNGIVSEKAINQIIKRQDQLWEEINLLEIKIEKEEGLKLIKPQQANTSRYQFYLDILPKEFPEILRLKESLFEVGDENKDFKKEEVKVINWKKVELGEGTKFGNYSLTLTKGKNIKTFIVYPVYEAKHYIEAMKDYHGQQGKLTKMKVDLKNKKEELKVLGQQDNFD